jgi:DNA polymerase III delta prime subunit
MTFHSGSPGTGKTTTAIAIAKRLNCPYKKINASLEGRIDTLKDEILTYGRQATVGTNIRIVILDEVDGVTSNAFFDSLRGVIDSTKDTLRFILTCNSLFKIPEPIRDRCPPVSFAFGPNDLVKREIFARLKQIAHLEVGDTGTVDEETLKIIAKTHYPSVRSMIKSLQFNHRENGGSIKGNSIGISSKTIEQIWNLIIEGKWEESRLAYSSNISDPSSFFRSFLDHALLMCQPGHRMAIASTVAEFQYRSVYQVDSEINITCGLFPALIKLVK